MRDPSANDPTLADLATWSADDTGSHAVDRELERELVRAALFDGCAAPRIGRFVVGERLGAGASAVVYAAWDALLARRVAVKVFVARSSASHHHVQREAQAMAQLSHRNVVAVYEVGDWKGHAFIAMELITGTTLARWQAARRRSIAELAEAYRQAGRGLAAAHQAGLVHRDFKPANVMVAEDGRVVVTDFGLAGTVEPSAAATGLPSSAPGSAVTTRAVLGTPAYVAPEQRRGATPHPSADIYSFALALCEALIGWHPMQHAEWVWREALLRRAPRRVYEAICTGLAKQPSARGSTITPLLAALGPAPRRRWRRSAVIALSGLATAALAIGLDRHHDGVASAPSPPPFIAPQFTAPLLRPVLRAIDAFVAAPPRPEGLATTGALRTLLLAALPSELRCAWPAPLVGFTLGEDHAIGLDDQGRVHACALDTGEVSLAASDARCISPGPGGAIVVMDRDRRTRVVRAGRAGWQAVRAIVPDPRTAPQPLPEAPCPVTILPELDGAVRVMIRRSTAAGNRSGRTLATATPSAVRIVDHTGAELASHELPDRRLYPLLDVSRDGARVLAAEIHGPLVWWQYTTGWHEERLYFQNPTLRQARLSPSGERAVLVDYFGGVEVRTLGGGRVAWLTSDAVTDAVFRDDDTVIASDGDHRLWRWDLASQRAGVAAVHDRAVWAVAANAEIVATGSEDGRALVIDRRTGAPQLELSAGSEIYRIVLDGDLLIAAGGDGLRVWNWRTGAAVPLPDSSGLRLWDVATATGANGHPVYLAGALTDGAIYAWDENARTRLHHAAPPAARISDVAVSPDGRTFAAVDSTGKLVVLDVATGRIVLQIRAHRASARRVAFDPATRTIVTAGDDGYLYTWVPPETAPRRSVQLAAAVYDLDVRAGYAVTGAADGSVTLVDLAAGRIERHYRGHDSAVRTVQLRDDGRWFVTGDHTGRACLWRIDADDCHTWLDGHRAGVLAATFADDGTVFTASEDGTVRYWRPTYDLTHDALLTELARRGARR